MPVFDDGQKMSKALAWNRMIQSVPASYVVWKDGSTYRAECLLKDGTDYSGTDAATVIQSAIDKVCNEKRGRIFFRAGDYVLDSQLTISDMSSGHVFIVIDGEGARLRRNFGGTDFLLEMKNNSYDGYVFFRNLEFYGVYDSLQRPLINIEGEGGGYVFENIIARYGLPTLRLQGHIWESYFDFKKIYLSQGYGYSYTGTNSIILVDGAGSYSDMPKINEFRISIGIYSSSNNPFDYALYLDGGYNIISKLQVDKGYWNKSVIKILGWSNTLYNYRGQDLLSTANTDANIHLSSTNCYGNYLEGQIADFVKSVKIDDGAFRNFIRVIPFGTSLDVDATGAGIDNMIEILTPHLLSGTSFTISHTGADVIYSGYKTENSGTATISSSTYVDVTHGLAGTPTAINVTPATSGTGDWYLSDIGATTFRINVANSGSYTFYWTAEYKP